MFEYEDIEVAFQIFLLWLSSVVIDLATFTITVWESELAVSLAERIFAFGNWIAFGNNTNE